MAENADELLMTGPYYCHHCEQNIASCTLDYTCTICNGGFIEPTSSPTTSTPISMSLSSIFGGDDDDDDDEEMESDTDDDDDRRRTDETPVSIAISHGNNSLPLRRGSRRTRISIHRLQSNPSENNTFFQNFLQQFLHSLLGNNSNQQQQRNNVNPFFFNSNMNDFVWTRGGLDNIITMFMNQLDNMGPPPAGKDTIDSLPTTTVPQQFIDDKTQCHVCMEDFVLHEEVKQLPCKHVYHQDCITPWLELHGTCPICRQVVEAANQQPQQQQPPQQPQQQPSHPIQQPSQPPQQPQQQDTRNNTTNTAVVENTSSSERAAYLDQINLD